MFKKMLVQRARSGNWKKWAAKHEYEELKEGAWLEPGLALLRKKVKENWTEEHRNVARKIFLEGGWTQKRLFDLGWSDVSQCQACQLEEGAEKHRLHHCPEWYEVRREIPQAFRKLKQKARTSEKEWKWQRGTVAHPLSESQWNRDHFSMKKWESEKHKNWGMPAEGFKGHSAPSKRAELTAFLCLLKKVCGPIKVHVDNRGIIDGLRKGEKECIKPRAGDADLWTKFWEELHEKLVKSGILVEVEHVKAHCSNYCQKVWKVKKTTFWRT